MIKRNLTFGAVLSAALTLSACGSDHGGHATNVAAGADSSAAGSDHSSMAGMDHSKMTPAELAAMSGEGDGSSPTGDGYTLAKVSTPKAVGSAGKLEFTILGPKGKAHKEFVLELTKLMHVYVVRKDLTGFQHLHPELDTATGRWSAPLTIEKAGPYRLVTEFDALDPEGNLDGRRLGTQFAVPGTYDKTPFKPSVGSASVDGYDVSVEGSPAVGVNDLKLTVRRDGQDVTSLQPYLDSWAHITGFRTGNLKVVHVHPNESPDGEGASGGPTLSLSPTFATAGTYRLFVQFQVEDVVRTVPIDLKVS